MDEITNTRIILGSNGQIGSELVRALCERFGKENVIACDIKPPKKEHPCRFEILDVLDKNAVENLIKTERPRTVYLLAALLSATAEKNRELAWAVNMDGLFTVLNLAKEGFIKKVFWPSSIAVFGPTTPKVDTPQQTITEPATVYGISKLAGERWCEYYYKNFGVDVRSIRYPGIIGWQTEPGGGTTDYAVDIFHKAIKDGNYTCFLEPTATLPMMHLNDAIRATIELMQVEPEKITVRSSYNLSGCSFSPEELTAAIKKKIKDFTIAYEPDFRQKIAEGWPQSINDTVARKDWGWQHEFNLEKLVDDMIEHIGERYTAKAE
ncbi:MAG: NAD-dependent epimerase/dehydratase family protein [Luteibaculaceae bacterium]